MGTPMLYVVAALAAAGLLAALASVEAAPAADYFVAPGGRDSWSGTLPAPNARRTDGPFATLERARVAAGSLSGRPRKRPCVVMLRDGTYRLARPFTLGPEDSGTAAAPVVYTAYHGEEPVLSAGRRVGGWKPAGEGLWSANLPDVAAAKWHLRELYVGGQRRLRARLPKEGTYPVAGLIKGELWDVAENRSGFRFRPGDLRKDWTNLADVEVVVLQYWTEARLRVAKVDDEANIVTFTGESWRPAVWSMGYYAENVLEGLTEPGQWYLNRKSGVLLYRPLPGEDMAKIEVTAPVAEQIVRLAGDPDGGDRVRHVVLRGLTFAHTASVLPPEGHAYPQAELPSAVHGRAPAKLSPPAAITATGAVRCAIEDCRIIHTGGWGIDLASACRDNRIVGCRFEDIGGGGIKIGEAERPATDAQEACRTLVSDCVFRDGSRVYLGSPAVWVGQSSGNTIRHNEMTGPWQWAVSLGWNWSYMPPNRTRDNLVEYNYCHHLGTGPLGNHSVIYALGISPGTIIRKNLIHHARGYAIGLDAATSGVLVEENISHHMEQGGIHFNWYCLGDIVQNNIFALGEKSQLTRYGDPPPGDDTNCNVFQRNILYWREGKLYNEEKWPNYRMVMDYNLYWHAGGEPVKPLGFTFDEWKAKGLDSKSVVADPLFRDPENGDFTLAPDSPALKLGFRPIDLRGVGPRPRKARTR